MKGVFTMMSNFEKMFAMMQKMEQMMTMFDKFEAMMGGSDEPQVAKAEATPPTTTSNTGRVSVEDILAEANAQQATTKEKVDVQAEFGFWKRTNQDGNSTTWCGWANPNNFERVFPGHRLYRINDFYLKKLGIKHTCYPGQDGKMIYSTNYNMRTADAKRILANYQVRDKVAKADKVAFNEYMSKTNAKAQQAVSDDWFEN